MFSFRLQFTLEVGRMFSFHRTSPLVWWCGNVFNKVIAESQMNMYCHVQSGSLGLHYWLIMGVSGGTGWTQGCRQMASSHTLFEEPKPRKCGWGSDYLLLSIIWEVQPPRATGSYRPAKCLVDLESRPAVLNRGEITSKEEISHIQGMEQTGIGRRHDLRAFHYWTSHLGPSARETIENFPLTNCWHE